MLSDADTFVMRKDPFNYFEVECANKKLWACNWDDGLSEIKLDSQHGALRQQISSCYGEKVLQEILSVNFPNANYPIAGRTLSFLELVTKSNQLRIETRENLLGNFSYKKVCDMVCFLRRVARLKVFNFFL